MAIREQILRFGGKVRANIAVTGAVALGLVGLGTPYALVWADIRDLKAKVQTERELQKKDEEDLKVASQAARKEGAEEAMGYIWFRYPRCRLPFNNDYEQYRRAMKREG